MEQEGGTRSKEGGEGGDPRKKEAEVKKRMRQKQKVEKVLVEEEEEIVCQGPLMVTKVLFTTLLLICKS